MSVPDLSKDGTIEVYLNLSGEGARGSVPVPSKGRTFEVDHNLSGEVATASVLGPSKDETLEVDHNLLIEPNCHFPQAASDQLLESCSNRNLADISDFQDPQDLSKEVLSRPSTNLQSCRPRIFPENCPSDRILSAPKESIIDALNFGLLNINSSPQVEPLDLTNASANSSLIEGIKPERKKKVMHVEARKRSLSAVETHTSDEPLNLVKKPCPLPAIKVLGQSKSRSSTDPFAKPKTVAIPSTSQVTRITVKPMPVKSSNANNLPSCSKSLDVLETTPEKKKYLQEKYSKKYQETPIKRKLRSKLQRKNRCIKSLNQSMKRKKSRVILLDRIIKNLRENAMMSGKDLETLKKIQGPHKELLERQLSSATKTRKQLVYGEELRSFALSLHYRSPSAYSYVREVFSKALPHPLKNPLILYLNRAPFEYNCGTLHSFEVHRNEIIRFEDTVFFN